MLAMCLCALSCWTPVAPELLKEGMTMAQVHRILGDTSTKGQIAGADASGDVGHAGWVESCPRYKLHIIYDVNDRLKRVERER